VCVGVWCGGGVLTGGEIYVSKTKTRVFRETQVSTRVVGKHKTRVVEQYKSLTRIVACKSLQMSTGY
jgi:hypothetical protein